MKIQQYSTVNKSSRNGYVPKFIVWHIAEGTYYGTIGHEQNAATETSSHFILGKDGSVAQLVPLDMAAWTQGKIRNPTHPYVKSHSSVNPNQYCVSIECEGFWKETKGKLTDAQFNSAVELTKHIVSEVKKLYNVDIPIDREHMIGHCEINTVTRPHCPGELFPFDKLIAAVNRQNKPSSGASGNTPAVDTKYHYTVQVGSYKNSINAESMYNEISNMGYFTFKQSVAGNTRVCVGKFENRNDAEITRKDLKKKGYEGFVTALNV